MTVNVFGYGNRMVILQEGYNGRIRLVKYEHTSGSYTGQLVDGWTQVHNDLGLMEHDTVICLKHSVEPEMFCVLVEPYESLS